MGFPRVEAQLTAQSGTPRGGGTAGKSAPSVPLHSLQTRVPLKEGSVQPRGRERGHACCWCPYGSLCPGRCSESAQEPLVGCSWGSPVVGSSVSAPGDSGGRLGTCYTSTAGGRGRAGPGCLQGQRDRSPLSHRQYYWYDERGKKVKCTAPQYVDFVMSSVQKLVTDEDVFPTKYGTSLPGCTPPCWAAVAADAAGPDLRDGADCVTLALKPGRWALAGISPGWVHTPPPPGSGACGLCLQSAPVQRGHGSPPHPGSDRQQAVAASRPDLGRSRRGSRPVRS